MVCLEAFAGLEVHAVEPDPIPGTELDALVSEMWEQDFRARPSMKEVVTRLDAISDLGDKDKSSFKSHKDEVEHDYLDDEHATNTTHCLTERFDVFDED